MEGILGTFLILARSRRCSGWAGPRLATMFSGSLTWEAASGSTRPVPVQDYQEQHWDKSSNGTRVNGIKVGKDKTWPLRLIEQESVCILLNNLIGRDFPSFSWAMTDWIKWCKICQDAATRTFMVE